MEADFMGFEHSQRDRTDHLFSVILFVLSFNFDNFSPVVHFFNSLVKVDQASLLSSKDSLEELIVAWQWKEVWSGLVIVSIIG